MRLLLGIHMHATCQTCNLFTSILLVNDGYCTYPRSLHQISAIPTGNPYQGLESALTNMKPRKGPPTGPAIYTPAAWSRHMSFTTSLRHFVTQLVSHVQALDVLDYPTLSQILKEMTTSRVNY